ncbi:DUF742 domain-containing protein [Planomonospora sp. ID82291]|uniref:DUF742 domain-containing protein n=1 Tax=Planomonospora sp. ID82291 TaxID=2738136 RepID=UPI0018C3BF01|nr:DUF742 domain-containing protein [Planomonospora sp. ID82291]
MTGDDPGPLIRLYGLTGGRARPAGESFDLVAIVTAVVTAAGAPAEPAGLVPEHLAALALCRRPTPVADVAAYLGLPLNVTRVLLGDLRREGLVTIDRPRPAAQTIDEGIYREVLHGLRRL